MLTLLSLYACHQEERQFPGKDHEHGAFYKPGFGEFMTSVQLHHAKLWFAGINDNWQLADFETHELRETIEDIREYESEKPESKLLDMIMPSLDSVEGAVRQKNQQQFKTNFIALTTTCNKCHSATGHAFNVIIVPQQPPVTNQRFVPLGEE